MINSRIKEIGRNRCILFGRLKEFCILKRRRTSQDMDKSVNLIVTPNAGQLFSEIVGGLCFFQGGARFSMH